MKRQFSPDQPRALRRGASLIEVMIAISIGSVILGVGMTTIHLLLRSERAQSRSLRTSATLSRLARIFRDDAHASSTCEIVENGEGKSRLVLSGQPIGPIAYLADEHQLHRTVGNEAAESHRDVFYFPPGSVVRFVRENAPALVRIEIDVAPATPRPEGAPALSPRTLSIEAAIDRDRRFARSEP